MQQIYQKVKIPSPGVVLAVMNLQEFPYFHFYTSSSGLRRKPSLQESSQPLLYRQWPVHPGCFAPTDCDNPIVFKEMAAHLRYNFLGLAYGRAPCQFSYQIFHFQPWYRSQANQITEKVVQEDISSSLDGYQPPSLQNEACHKLFFSPTIHIQFTYNISPPHSIWFNSRLSHCRWTLKLAMTCWGVLLGLGLGTYLTAFQNQDLKENFKTWKPCNTKSVELGFHFKCLSNLSNTQTLVWFGLPGSSPAC